VASRLDTPVVARALGDLAMASYKMVPGVGARCIKPGTSSVWALTQLSTPEALAQLSRVRQLVKFGTAKKVLDAAFARLSAALGVTPDDLHEMAAPDFDLNEDGTLREPAGDFELELRVETSGAELRILKAGSPVKDLPAAAKREHGDVLKALKQKAADINKILPAQKDRIERLYHSQRTWDVDLWRRRYIDHPLVGVLARRLIWRFDAAGKTLEGLWNGQSFSDSQGRPFELPTDGRVQLWHPIAAEAAHVLEWRSFLEKGTIRQPFKQAHREVYQLTDAERRTETYSNRFAAHVIKQAQLTALCQNRGWTIKMFVLEYGESPRLWLPEAGLYAHFEVSPIGDDMYGTAGASSYLQTDRVRFTRNGEGPDVPLDQVPPLTLSEVMRDVDLFVGVCSVGNNPQWSDGGPGGAYRDYWQNYSFGDLSATGKTRHDLLTRLLPRLKIAPACTLTDRFLEVRGHLRTYKIHLGSGNILMAPNDQYLCIVPTSRDEKPAAFLPFEGDRTLSIILSKAFLLAEDGKITDTSITRQIKE
jgi:hypothetical protein